MVASRNDRVIKDAYKHPYEKYPDLLKAKQRIESIGEEILWRFNT